MISFPVLCLYMLVAQHDFSLTDKGFKILISSEAFLLKYLNTTTTTDNNRSHQTTLQRILMKLFS